MNGPNPEQIAKAGEAGRLGMTNALTAAYIGVSGRTVDNWRRKGGDAWLRAEQGEELSDLDRRYMAFYRAQEAGKSTNSAEALAMVIKAAREGSWQAAAWMLERRHGYVRTGVHEVRATIQAAEVDREALARHLAAKLGLDDGDDDGCDD